MEGQQVEALLHEIDRDIYGMPAFETLVVRDLAASRTWYAALGSVELAVMPPDQTEPHLVRDDVGRITTWSRRRRARVQGR